MCLGEAGEPGAGIVLPNTRPSQTVTFQSGLPSNFRAKSTVIYHASSPNYNAAVSLYILVLWNEKQRGS